MGSQGLMLSRESGRRSPANDRAMAALVTLGVLTICGGLMLFGGSAALIILLKLGVSIPGIPPAHYDWWQVGIGVALAATPTVLGAAEIVCGIKICNGSRRAARVAAVIVGLQMTVPGALCAYGMWEWLGPGPRADDMLFGMLIFLLQTAVLGGVMWLVITTLRERQPAVSERLWRE